MLNKQAFKEKVLSGVRKAFGSATQAITRGGESAQKALANRAAMAKHPASRSLYQASARVADAVAHNPGAAMLAAGTGAAGLGAGAALHGSNKQASVVDRAAKLIKSPKFKVNDVLPAVPASKRDDVLAKLRNLG